MDSDSLSGVAVLAVVGLWLAYVVPHRLRQRQQMLESRVNDRFSGSLRVLAVATADASGAAATRKPNRGAAAAALHPRGDCTTSSSSTAPLLTLPHGMSVRPTRHHPEGEQDMEQPHSPTSVGAPARTGLHARRAAAARRRALLTVILLVLTAATGALAATTAVSGWFVLVPAALLGSVLVLGRRAVRAHARADAAWEARERARRSAAPGRQRLTGRPASGVRPQVTGHAVKSSQVRTQMIARVRPASSTSRAHEGEVPALHDSGDMSSTDEAPDVVAPTAPAPGAVVSTTGTTGVTDATGAAGTARPAAGTADLDAHPAAHPAQTSQTSPAATEWVSVPVPRPVYTMKSAAPRWEPAPLTAEMAQIAQARRDELAADDDARSAAAPAGAATGAGAASASVPAETPSDSLGVNLNDVLARRRAAGE